MVQQSAGTRRWWLFVGVAALVVVFDQITKEIIRASVDAPIVVVEGFFRIVHVGNPGAAFSLLATAPQAFRDVFFSLVGVVAVGLLSYLTAHLKVREMRLAGAYGGVLGGAVGNLVDRARFGEVTDFLDFYYGSYHWPAFNVADSSITVSIVLVLLWSAQLEATADPTPSAD